MSEIEITSTLTLLIELGVVGAGIGATGVLGDDDDTDDGEDLDAPRKLAARGLVERRAGRVDRSIEAVCMYLVLKRARGRARDQCDASASERMMLERMNSDITSLLMLAESAGTANAANHEPLKSIDAASVFIDVCFGAYATPAPLVPRASWACVAWLVGWAAPRPRACACPAPCACA